MKDKLISELKGTWREIKTEYPDTGKEVKATANNYTEWNFFGNNSAAAFVIDGRTKIKDGTIYQWDVSEEPNSNGNYDLIVQHEPRFEIISLETNILKLKRNKTGFKSFEYYKKQ